MQTKPIINNKSREIAAKSSKPIHSARNRVEDRLIYSGYEKEKKMEEKR